MSTRSLGSAIFSVLLGSVLLGACSPISPEWVDQGPAAATGTLDGREFKLRGAMYIKSDGIDARLVLSDDPNVCANYGEGLVQPGTMQIELQNVATFGAEQKGIDTRAWRVKDKCTNDEALDFAFAYQNRTTKASIIVDDSGTTATPRMYGRVEITWDDGSQIKGEFKAVPCNRDIPERIACRSL